MKKLRSMIMAVVLVLMVVPAAFAGVETSGYASVDVMSSYVWRGIQLHEAAAVQPSVGITYGNFGANFWANYDSDDAVKEIIETDLTLNYVFEVDKLAFDVGYIYYALDGFADTQEFYVSASYDVLLSPTLTLYYDVDEGDGGFIVAAISHSLPVMEDKASINLGASASYNMSNLVMGVDPGGDEFSGLYNGELTASLSYAVNDNFSVEPKIAYSMALSDDAEFAIESMSENGESGQFYGGVSLALNF
ncbi:MAG: hypothetical protein JSV21_07440 [Nitrospirota bacterium]|nr:MAG: hypothetical protein JSV21_07440 [Nitrospirota bacterium]